MSDDPIKWGGKAPMPVDLLVSQPVRVSNFVANFLGEHRSLLDHISRYGFDAEYTAECDRRNAALVLEEAAAEAKRRASLRPWQRWNEDHTYFWRKLWPWTIVRWTPPVDDDWDDD